MVSLKIELDPAEGVEYTGDRRLRASHYRMCYRRAHQDYRLRDEIPDSSGRQRLFHVRAYTGDLNGNWQDGGSHIFHDGPVYIDEDLVAHLIDPDLEETDAEGR